jgi:urea transporter
LGIVCTVFVQAAMDALLLPFGIPSLTAPFCIATWLFLLPMFRLDDAEPDHSHWQKRE